ncbi:MAG TPA: hypothetical protein VEZ11_17715 [Thermoanaerobaculia bacterium]|nr:hypothetical protein [Thermoanaerobaculia bacterium]
MRRTDLLAALLLVAIVAALFGDVLFGGAGFYFRDLFRYHYPMKQIVRQTIAAGDLPLWNRLYAGGQPMAANPAYEVFYPPQWLIFAGPYAFGFQLHILFHVVLALTGMFALLRELRVRVATAVAGALSFGLSGFFLATVNILPTCFVWSWAPLAALFLHRFERTRARRDLALSALVLGMQALVTEPVALVGTWALLVAWIAWRGLLRGAAEGLLLIRRDVTALAIVIVLALALASVQLLPAADHLRDSARSRGMTFEQVASSSLHPSRVLELAFPRLFGSLVDDGALYWSAWRFGGRPYLLSLYCGLLVATMLVAGLACRVPGSGFAALVIATSTLLASGYHTPLARWLYDLGLIRWLRFPEKLIAPAMFVAVIFAAVVLERFVSGDRRVVRAATIAACAIAASSIVLWAISFLPSFPAAFAELWRLPRTWLPAAAMFRDTARLSAMTAVAFAAVILAGHRSISRLWWAALFATVAVDLGVFSLEVLPRMPRRFFTPPGAVAVLDRDTDAYSIFSRGDWIDSSDRRRYETAGSGAAWFIRNGLVPPSPAAWGLRTNLQRDYDETDLLPTRDLLDAMVGVAARGVETWDEPFLARSNIRYVTDYADFDKDLAAAAGDFSISQPIHIRRAGNNPRYYFASSLMRVETVQAMIDAIDQHGAMPGTAFVAIRPFQLARGRVASWHETATSAVVDVEAQGPAYLVITVTRHKYWNATLDGRSAELLPTNLAYQGLRIPPGRHRVVMRYRNPLVVAGAAISLSALLVIVLLMLPFGRGRRGDAARHDKIEIVSVSSGSLS